MEGGAWWSMVHGVRESDMTEVTEHAGAAITSN